MKRIIVVGMGSIGIRHARICQQLGNLKVELCDAREEGLAEAKAILGELECWNSWEAALASRPEVMIIATPHGMHAGMVCEALAAGVDVLCEKPMSDSVEGAASMVQAVASTDRTLRIGFMLRFQPAIRKLRALLKEGALGTVISMRYHIGSLVTLENSRSRYQATLPGALVMDYIHGLDLLLWLTGYSPKGVYARSLQTGQLPLSANPTLFTALVDFEEPFMAEIHMDYAAKPQLHELVVVGDRGMVRLELSKGTMEVRYRDSNRKEEIPFSFQFDQVYEEQMKAFLAAVDGRCTDHCTPEEGLAATRLMQRLLESAQAGERLSFE